jgi:CopA family copper-resistance protein
VKLSALVLGVFAVLPLTGFAKTVRYELNVANQSVNLSGKETVDFALTVNGGIPAPTLEFTEGDDAEIVVKNGLANEEVSIHWHGILLPPEEDGVAYVNTPPIFPGKSHTFRFKIRQHGTYWYHSHTMVQEQKGVYGAFIIHPKKETIKADKEVVAVLSDWSDENADQIIKNLRKDGDYYLYKKDSIRSYFGAIGAGGLGTMLKNEWDRMGGMDLSDVGYDAFLINGKRDSQLLVAHPGEKVRIRVINAGASSYFYVSMGKTPFQVISADGVDINPVWTNEILMGMAETYDILFTVPEHKNYELRATVQDVTGYASGWIGMGEKVPAPTKSMPDLYAPMDHGSMGHGEHGGMDHSKMDHGKTGDMDHSAHAGHVMPATDHQGHENVDHSQMDHSKMNHGAMDHSKMDHSAMGHAGHSGHGKPSTGSKQAKLKAKADRDPHAGHGAAPKSEAVTGAVVETLTVDELKAPSSTVLPKNAPVHEVKLVLGGDMERYVWHINGKAIHEDRTLEIKEGEVVRYTFVNDTMMHHPMHLHGHFFRVINKNGDLSPLKHTVDVPPHGSRTIEFYANEPGEWMLHCHNLYHMKTGMARVVKYSTFTPKPEIAAHQKHDPHLHDHLYWDGMLEAATNHGRIYGRLSKTWDTLELDIEAREEDKSWGFEGDLLYRRWFGQFFNLIAGGTSFHDNQRAMVGVGYILPMLIETNLLVDHKGDLRLDVERKFQWTKHIFTEGEISIRQHEKPEWEVNLMYGPNWHWAAGVMLTDDKLGVGAQWKF